MTYEIDRLAKAMEGAKFTFSYVKSADNLADGLTRDKQGGAN